MISKPVVDYRRLRPWNLNTPEFSHLWLLLFWPIFFLTFELLEWGHVTNAYHVMHCALDDIIPFAEIMVIPYIGWFVFLLVMHIYTLLYEPALFVKLEKFIIITYGISMIIMFLYPSAQHLRPDVFPRDNIFSSMVGWFYRIDTSTNVCPSLHVVGGLACTFAGCNSERLKSAAWKFIFCFSGFMISISTVFLKQHSAIDVVVGCILCFAILPVVYFSGSPERVPERKLVRAANR